MTNQYKFSVVNLEGATSSQPYDFSGQFSKDLRFSGTALFLKKNNRRYLITAKHVLADPLPINYTPDWVKDSIENYPLEDGIFKIIFRIPILRETKYNEVFTPMFLMNLSAGVPQMRPYTFSQNLDLAVVSLDSQHSKGFADQLENDGYIPIDYSMVSHGPDFEGQDVYTIGFPAATSIMKNHDMQSAIKNWSSAFVSNPVFTFGKVAMLEYNTPRKTDSKFKWKNILNLRYE